MHPEISQMINATRNHEMRQQAAAWRRVREARRVAQVRPISVPVAVVTRFARRATSPGQKPVQGPAAA